MPTSFIVKLANDGPRRTMLLVSLWGPSGTSGLLTLSSVLLPRLLHRDFRCALRHNLIMSTMAQNEGNPSWHMIFLS